MVPAVVSFLSTLPARGATSCCRAVQQIQRHISIHAPREGSDQQAGVEGVDGVVISIHAPREGSDAKYCPACRPVVISIHAPREGSD